MLSQWLFSALVLLVGLQRLLELGLSRRHEALLRRAGAREHAPRHFRAMAAIHALWLPAMLLEVWAMPRRAEPWLSLVAGGVFIAGQCLRYAAIRALGTRWSVRIYTLPGVPPIDSGIYRYLRHPNYLGVVLEMAALPLMHSAWVSALVFSLANAALLRVRIREEEHALA